MIRLNMGQVSIAVSAAGAKEAKSHMASHSRINPLKEMEMGRAINIFILCSIKVQKKDNLGLAREIKCGLIK